jgi:TM2 domain-containing membrane protein YozV
MLSKPKDRRIAVLLAGAGIFLPLAGWHKFYLGQRGWGILYLLLSCLDNRIVHVACAAEALWYLFQTTEPFNPGFQFSFNPAQTFSGTSFSSTSSSTSSSSLTPAPDLSQVSTIADALRQLETLRQDGLISEYEFEQKRRQLLDRIQ